MLDCHIQAPQSVKVGSPIPLTFTLSNRSERTVAVLKWNTPLEGWFGNSFNVTKDGKAVTYQGAMVKRFRPSAEDYAEIKPGQSISAEVDMAQGYDMSASGQYQLSFKGRLQDVQYLNPEQGVEPEIKLHSLSCNTLTVTVQ